MKKFFPFLVLLAGFVVVVSVYFFVIRGRGSQSTTGDVSPTTEDLSMLRDVPINEQPVVSMVPTSDGHFLNLTIDKIQIDAYSMEYTLLYKMPDGREQGVPGIIPMNGQTKIERKMLLGSESSGKFRYDEGVEKGTFTLKFRNSDGKLIARFETDFHLQHDTDTLTSMDGNLAYKLAKSSPEYFVTMHTFGLINSFQGNVKEGPYGIFSSATKAMPGTASTVAGGDIYQASSSSWTKLAGGNAKDIGMFLVASTGN